MGGDPTGIISGGGDSSSSSSSQATNQTSVTSNVTTNVQNVIDASALAQPVQKLTDALTGMSTTSAANTAVWTGTVKDIADTASAAAEKTSRDQLLVAALTVAAAYYGARSR